MQVVEQLDVPLDKENLARGHLAKALWRRQNLATPAQRNFPGPKQSPIVSSAILNSVRSIVCSLSLGTVPFLVSVSDVPWSAHPLPGPRTTTRIRAPYRAVT
jgi:hypothetical protein